MSLQTHRQAGIEDKQCTMQPFRARGAASHKIDGSVVGVPMKYVGRKPITVARKYAGVTASESAAGMKRSREIAIIEAGVLPLSGQCARSYTAFPWDNGGQPKPNPLGAKVYRSLDTVRTTRNPR